MFYSRVYDAKTGHTIGNLLNITVEGAMVLSDRQVTANILMELHIELPDGFADKSELVIKGKSLWCQKDINPEFFDIGYQFLELNPKDEEIIQKLVKEYGFRDRVV